MSLTVKAFLFKSDSSTPEIRRIAVPADVSSNYEYLFRKLSEIFPSLKSGNFVLYWKDPDNDLVAFSTDEELVEALGYVNDSVFQVFIKEKHSENTPDDGQSKDEFHPGVTCDGRKGLVFGIRFKCSVCPDYDLCATCKDRDIHTEHKMMQISSPAALWKMFGMGVPPCKKAWGGRGRHGSGLRGHSPFRHNPYGPPGPHVFGQYMHGPKGPSGPGPHGVCHGPQEPFVPPPHFRRWMQKFMRHWHGRNTPEGCPCVDDDEKVDKHEQPMDQEEQGENQYDTTPEECYLQSVGEQVAVMLDPFGIDVCVDVDTEGNRTARRHCEKGQGKCRRQGHQHDKNKDKPSTKDSEKQQGAENSKTESKIVDEDNVVHEISKLVVNTDGPHKKADNDWTMLDRLNGESSKSSTSGPIGNQVETNGLVPVTPAITVVEPPIAPVYPPTDINISNALQKMMAMGFTNEGGWMTRLF